MNDLCKRCFYGGWVCQLDKGLATCPGEECASCDYAAPERPEFSGRTITVTMGNVGELLMRLFDTDLSRWSNVNQAIREWYADLLERDL